MPPKSHGVWGSHILDPGRRWMKERTPNSTRYFHLFGLLINTAPNHQSTKFLSILFAHTPQTKKKHKSLGPAHMAAVAAAVVRSHLLGLLCSACFTRLASLGLHQVQATLAAQGKDGGGCG
jgi:hypothetical protein